MTRRSSRRKPYPHLALLWLLATALSITGCHRAQLSVSGPVEYSLSPVDTSELIVCDDKDAKLDIQTGVDASQVGTQIVTVQIGEGPFARTEDLEVQVVDTQEPEVTLKHDKVEVQMDGDFDPYDEIGQVSDPVDGELPRVTEVPEIKGTEPGSERFFNKGWYFVVGEFDLKKAGTYTLDVYACDQHGNETHQPLTVEVLDPLENAKLNKNTSVLEYAQEDIDPVELVTCSVGDATVTADELSLRKVGKKKVVYTVTKGSSSRTIKRTFRIRDTQAPVITLESSDIEVSSGASFDKFANVVSVIDPVDGQLRRVATEPTNNGKGWYTVVGDVNTSEAGYQMLSVVACDRHGNRSSIEFGVQVAQPDAETTDSDPALELADDD